MFKDWYETHQETFGLMEDFIGKQCCDIVREYACKESFTVPWHINMLVNRLSVIKF
jgi:hypothetical protein